MLAFTSPYVADTFDHVKVGVACPTVRVAVVDADSKFAVEVGVNVAVITDDPAPAIVAVESEMVATDVVAERNDHAPATADPPNVAVGLLNPNAASPKVFVEILNPPSVGVAFRTVTVIVTVPPETKFVVLLGVNVPVIVAEPALPKSSSVSAAAIAAIAPALDS